MKKKLLTFLCRATTIHKRKVLWISGFLCLASIGIAIGFLKFDLTFKGAIGKGIEVVDAYDRVIRDFKVSGVLTPTAEPRPEEVVKVLEAKRRIDSVIFDILDEEGKRGVASILEEYSTKDMRTLSDRSTIKVVMAVLSTLPVTELPDLLKDLASLDAQDTSFVLDNLGSGDSQKVRAVYRKFQRLNRKELASLISSCLELPPKQIEMLRSQVLKHLTIN